jgi:glycosyltransferase involved in cell wall biosynthesis
MEGDEFHFVVICPSDSILIQRLEGTAAEIITVDMARGIAPIKDLKTSLALWRVIRAQACKVVHLHSSKAGLLGRIPGKLCRKTVVYTPHAFSFEAVRDRKLLHSLYVAAERFLGFFTDHLICVSNSEKELAAVYKLISPDKVSVINNFFDPDLWFVRESDPKLKEELGIPESHQLVGTISRFFPQKGPMDFVLLAEHIAKQRSDVSFIIVGEGGPLEAEVREQIRRRGLQDRIRILSWTDNLARLIASFDVVVSTSRYEGMPLSLIECMAMKKAIVATDIAPHRELISSAISGLLSPVGMPERMAADVLQLLGDDQKAGSLAMNARSSVLRDYTLDSATRALSGFYRKLDRG